MKVEQVKINDLSYELVVTIDKADAQDKKKKALSEYRRKAEIRGFRKGMAPMSLIEKMHGVQALVEGVNQLISEGINNHIAENKLNILGEPLPNEEKQKEINWESDETYEFVFDIALSPKVEFTLDSNDKIVSYNVAVSKEAVNAYKSNMLKQFGKLENIDEVKDETVVMNFNHPLAGAALHFTGKVEAIREATETELTNGLFNERAQSSCGDGCASDCSSCGCGCGCH